MSKNIPYLMILCIYSGTSLDIVPFYRQHNEVNVCDITSHSFHPIPHSKMTTETKEIEKSSSVACHEKFPVNDNLQRDPEQHFDVASIDLVQRRLKQRHIQM